MAKKRKRKRKKQSLKQDVKFELFGLLFIFLAILSSGASEIAGGFVPRWLELLFRLMFGIWYIVPSLFLFGLGIYVMIKRTWPPFFHVKFIGFYIIFASVILFTHVQVYSSLLTEQMEPSILKSTWNHFSEYVRGNVDAGYLGGGMSGASLFAFSYYLFSPTGSNIIAVFGVLVGFLFVTQISLGKYLQKLFLKIKTDGLQTVENVKQKMRDKREMKREQQKQKGVEEHEKQEPSPEQRQAVQDEWEDEPIIQDFTEHVFHRTIDIGDEEEAEKNNNPKTDSDHKREEAEESGEEQGLPLTEVENEDYQLPSLDLLAEPVHNAQQQERSKIQQTVRKLERTFESFGVKARVAKVHVGPSVTKYEVHPDVGVKVSKIVSLHDDLALALAAKDIRIEAPIPGKSAIGIEVPNQEVAMVSLREVLESGNSRSSSRLMFALGRDISGEAVFGELNKMPHLLVAGATGSGKSVCINGIITSILMRAKPHEVKMMMIDPKKVELNVYNGIPHLLSPVVTDPKKAARALKKVVAEMERRYDLFSETGTRNIEGYNEYIRRVNQHEDESQPQLPYIVVLIDELADLMMVASSDVEDAITRLAQMARAAGIHLIIATQRPSVDVITGVIKANIPSRIAFSVSSSTDSRTILDMNGAEKLLGRGDMLFLPVGASKPTRVQGAFVSDEEVEKVVDFCIEQQKAQYQEEMIPEEESEVTSDVEDDLFEDAVQLVAEMQSASVSMLQRRFRIGYTRAARLIDAMEERGIVGPYEGSKPRKVLISNHEEEKSS
ncbi:FtsK/SpoIIIE family DNA translocase [Melghiribacillus thermohalophilus]|uniref:FtsK/SpoIIIE family DNA translocase n=1 Tax=Melghiribacillus thermohalophilus TaxID=1324956 RepID=UPI0010455B34|nr:DNA translocase FtsK [Melghiribacillus thermohalophilus]